MSGYTSPSPLPLFSFLLHLPQTGLLRVTRKNGDRPRDRHCDAAWSYALGYVFQLSFLRFPFLFFTSPSAPSPFGTRILTPPPISISRTIHNSRPSIHPSSFSISISFVLSIWRHHSMRLHLPHPPPRHRCSALDPRLDHLLGPDPRAIQMLPSTAVRLVGEVEQKSARHNTADGFFRLAMQHH